MAENVANKLLESPLLTAIQDRWIEFEEDINSLQVQAADLILYTVWVLDSIKTQTTGFEQTMWKMTHTALRKRFIESQFKSDKGDLEYLTNLTCAYALYCYGLTITDNMKEVSNIPWDQQTPPEIVVEPILSTDLAYRVLWPLSTSDLNNDKQLEQTPGYEDDVE